jgi:arylsulfatase A-like enzyme
VLCALLALGACTEDVPARPSVVLVSIDTLRADHLGLYGYWRDTSPTLDRLAEESVVFERAFAPAAWTLISHMTMLTGLYPNQHGVVAAEWALARETPLLAERLREAGYRTVGLYFEGWIHARHGFDRGFDVFRAHVDAEEAGEHLAEELAALDGGRPLFLFLHLFDVHSGPLSTEPGPIYDCPPPYDELFLPGAAALLPDVPEGELWQTKGPLPAEALQGLTALYDGGIRYVDDLLEGWFDALRAAGHFDEALVVVTSDHGESLGQRGTGIRDHGGAYQEGLRVPLVVRPPGGVPGGRRVDATVHLADVVPTVLAEVGLPPSAQLPGLSLLGPQPDERTVYGLSPPSFEVVVRWPNKYVRLVTQERSIRVDLAGDPEELVGEPLDDREYVELRDAALAEIGEGNAFPAPVAVDDADVDPEELERRLAELGYGGEDG